MPLYIETELAQAKARRQKMAQQIEARMQFVDLMPESAADAIKAHSDSISGAKKALAAQDEIIAEIQAKVDAMKAPDQPVETE